MWFGRHCAEQHAYTTHVAYALPCLLAGLNNTLREEAVEHGHRRRLVVAAQQKHAAARDKGEVSAQRSGAGVSCCDHRRLKDTR